MSVKGRSLQLFFIDGRPEGMLTAKVFGWTGHILVTPRTQLAEALEREEAKCTGVYILLDEIDYCTQAYIGQSDNIGKRITQHVADRDWWSTAILITTEDSSLNRGHAGYLEARLISMAKDINQIDLENRNNPVTPSLTEADIANMEVFLEHILLVLPALRINFLTKQTRERSNQDGAEGAVTSTVRFEINSARHGLKAAARLQDGELIVEKGSLARSQWSVKHNYRRLSEILHQYGILRKQVNGKTSVFTKDYAFKSPSAGAAVVLGRPANGPKEWKIEGTNKSYRELEAEILGIKKDGNDITSCTI